MSEDIAKLQGRRTVFGNTPRDAQVGNQEKPAEHHRAALEKIHSGGVATKVRILVDYDSCPVCRAFEGAYDFDNVPPLPHEGCSHPQGCRCHYEPILDRFGP